MVASKLGSSHVRATKMGSLAVADQCLFSGTNFLTSVLIGRFAGAEQLGTYALVFSLVMLSICLQRALLISPYVVIHPTLSNPARESMRSFLLAASLLGGFVLAIAAIPSLFWLNGTSTLTIMLCFPAALLRDQCRRGLIAELKLRGAVAIDAVVAALQIGLIGWLAFSGSLTAMTALTVAASIWLGVSLGAITMARGAFGERDLNWGKNFALLWPIGRWSGLSQLVSTSQAFVLPWILAVGHSLELAGVFAACWSLVQVASPIVEGLGNLLGPILSRTLGGDDKSLFGRRVRLATLAFGALMSAMLVVVVFGGHLALNIFYGAAYEAHHRILVLLTLAYAATTIGIPASKAMTQLGHARSNAIVHLAGFATTALLAPLLLWLMGPEGAAVGLVIGGLVLTSLRWTVFRSIRRENHRQTPETLLAFTSVNGKAS